MIVHELDPDLSHAATRACGWLTKRRGRQGARGQTGSAKDSGHLDELDGIFGGIHGARCMSMTERGDFIVDADVDALCVFLKL